MRIGCSLRVAPAERARKTISKAYNMLDLIVRSEGRHGKTEVTQPQACNRLAQESHLATGRIGKTLQMVAAILFLKTRVGANLLHHKGFMDVVRG